MWSWLGLGIKWEIRRVSIFVYGDAQQKFHLKYSIAATRVHTWPLPTRVSLPYCHANSSVARSCFNRGERRLF